MKRSTYIAAIAALAILALVRVAATHRVLSETVDEPLHLAAGWQWLGGEYAIDISHPPLARVLAALPLRFAGLPDPPRGDDVAQGNFLLYHGDRYEKHLARARMGNLLLFLVAILAVAEQARRAFGRGIAVLASALFTNLPPVLGHAGLVTTDMAVTAAIPLSLLALDRFLEAATWKRAIALGAAIAMGVLGKFSFFVYFPAAALVLVSFRGGPSTLLRMTRRVPVVVLVAFVVIWGGYHFRFRPMSEVFYGAGFWFAKAFPDSLQTKARAFADTVPIPAPGVPVGLALLKLHDQQGHLAYLLGETSQHGWWYYFPVVFFFKTPLPFLLLAIAGVVLARRSEHAWIPLAILLVAMTGSINIGVRHVLPMYASLSIVAAYALFIVRRRIAAWVVAAWLLFGTIAAHPDYLAWFNEAAGKNPSRIAVDSNFDWGQDVLRLERVVRELKIRKLWVLYSTNALLDRHGIPAEALPGDLKVSGWVAVGETPMALWGEHFRWLEPYRPVRRVGKSIRLYYVP